MLADVEPSHAKSCVAVRTEVDRVVGAHDQTGSFEGEGPDEDLGDVQEEHEEN